MLTLKATDEILSPCCMAEIFGSLGDGVLIGTCSKCQTTVCRRNPRTGAEEWLNGASPWTHEDAAPAMSAPMSTESTDAAPGCTDSGAPDVQADVPGDGGLTVRLSAATLGSLGECEAKLAALKAACDEHTRAAGAGAEVEATAFAAFERARADLDAARASLHYRIAAELASVQARSGNGGNDSRKEGGK